MRPIVLALTALLALSCEERAPPRPDPSTAPTPAPGARLLGLQVNEGKAGFDEAMRAAAPVGAQVISMPVMWDELEPRPGVYEAGWLKIAAAWYPAHAPSMLHDLVVNPVDTNRARLPPDLAGRPFDDPGLIRRYERALDFVLEQTRALNVRSLSVGNEVDHVLRDDPEAWRAYGALVRAAVARVHAKRPGVRVGVKITFDGVTHPVRGPLARALNAHTDEVMLTYYPLDEDGMKRGPEIEADLARVVAAFPERALSFAEIGCPSGAGLKSSESIQAECVRAVFAAWDRAPRVRWMHFTWLHDAPPAEVERYVEYYGYARADPAAAAAFRAFVGTLGLRTWDGRDKAGFRALVDEARARGWSR